MWTMSRDSGALAYVQSPGTSTSRCGFSSSATPAPDMFRGDRCGVVAARSPNPPPTLMGGGQRGAERLARVCSLRHESVSLSVSREVVAALVDAGALLAQLHEDVVEQRGRAEPVQLGGQPVRPQCFVHEDEMLHRLL